ncbi:phage minor head protein [uncultured Shewanella sp.]|uniref:phage minor head protein n=1 Tax=uncultured Shewanella sp. TaxID=173975 RepID=UPI0026214DCF|nr:phage minor head protein [uncultured Shewanella sp.]
MVVNYGSLPFKEAIAFFRAKLNVPSERWNDIWQTGHNQSFMVAGALKDHLLNDFRRAVDNAIAEGRSLTWFKREFNQIVAQHGWQHTGSSDWRASVIYDTNVRQSYNAGRYEQLQSFDYWEYQHGDSRYPREMHLKWHGTLLPKEHSWWQTHMPQNGWGCKCRVRGRSGQALARAGKAVTKPPKDGVYDWTDKATGETHQIPKGIDPGFDYAPSKRENLIKQTALSQQAAKPFTPPERVVPSAYSTIKGVNVHGLNQSLDALASTDSAAQVALLGQFLAKQQTKTLFVKQAEMGRGKKANHIVQDVADYLDLSAYEARGRYYTRNASRVNGFTAKLWDHVVVKAKANVQLASMDMQAVKQAADKVVLAAMNNDGPRRFYVRGKTTDPIHRYWSVSAATEQISEAARVLTTWLHEIGHQVHFKAEQPDLMAHGSVSQYGFANHKEHFAEWFTAYMLAPMQVKNYNETLYTLIEQTLKQAIAHQATGQ